MNRPRMTSLAMRRPLLILVAAFAVGAAALSAEGRTVAHEDGLTESYRFSFAGRGASGFWTNCPPEPRSVTCTFTFVSVADEMIKEDGTKFQATTLYLDQFTSKFDRKGNETPVSFRFGFGDAALSVDPKLTTASADATVPLTTCTFGRRGTCVEGGSAAVNGSWSGLGDLVRVNSNFHEGSRGFTLNGHFRGTFRSAAASVEVNGSDVGAQLFANIFDARSGEVFICHGAC